MAKKTKLTVKEAKLVKATVEGKNQTEAGLIADNNRTPESARVWANETLQKTTVQQALQSALEKHNLTPDRIMGIVSDGMDATKINIVRDPMGGEDSSFAEETPDHSIRLKAAGMAAGFMGINKQESGTTNYNFINVQKQDKDEFGI